MSEKLTLTLNKNLDTLLNSITNSKSGVTKLKTFEKTFTFLDIHKRQIKCKINDMDKKGTVHCWWCRHQIDKKKYQVLHCPINYILNTQIKEYRPTVCPKYISQDISTDKLKFNFKGFFCSFPCIQAFINDNKDDKTFDLSSSLLLNYYEQMTNKKIKRILPAPHWKQLKIYGGDLTINKFQKKMNVYNYDYSGCMMCLEYFRETIDIN